MSVPRIVVGMGCYDDAQYLHETIPAVLAQTVKNFGFLLFDNGSTDNSGAIMREYAAKDKRIRLLASPVNLSPPHAANFVWGHALARWPTVQWFVAVGADDIMGMGYLAAILKAAKQNPAVNCIYSPVTYINHPERGVKRWPTYDPATVHAEPQIPGWRAFTRKLWVALGGEDTHIRIGADWDWAVRASAAGVFRPLQLAEPHLALRVRTGARVSQSSEVDWPALHRHLCRVVGRPYPDWVKAEKVTA